MVKPQQPELHRSGHGSTDPASTKAAVRSGLLVTGDGGVGPIPPDNRPGHHPSKEQDIPEVVQQRSDEVMSKRLTRIDIVKKGGEWVGQTGDEVVSRGRTKRDAIRNTAQVAKAKLGPVTVKIHGQDGRIQEERTYPSGADPHRTRG